MAVSPPTSRFDQLARSAFLDATDHAVLAVLRGDHTRLGYAVQLPPLCACSAPSLDAPTAVPSVLVTYLAQQLGVAPTDHLDRYQHSRMRWLHTLDIRRRYDYRDYRDPRRGWRFVRWLFARAWLGNERPSLLFDHAVSWLRAQKVVLPGITVLERDVARVRDRANERLWRLLARDLTPAHRQQLDALLIVPPGAQFTPLSSFAACRRRPAVRASSTRSPTWMPCGSSRSRRSCRASLGSTACTAWHGSPSPPGRRPLPASPISAVPRHSVRLSMSSLRWPTIPCLTCSTQVFTTLLGEATKAGTQARVRTLADLGCRRARSC